VDVKKYSQVGDKEFDISEEDRRFQRDSYEFKYNDRK